MTTDDIVNVRLPVELHAAATERARADDRSLAALIRCALRYYLAETQPIAPAPSTSGWLMEGSER